jgi:hypothetical protein
MSSRQRFRLAAFRAHHRERRLGSLDLAVHEEDARALAGHEDRGRPPVADALVDLRARARDDRDLACEPGSGHGLPPY